MLVAPKSGLVVFDTPPEFSLKDLIVDIQRLCSETGTSAVRYLKLDGDERTRTHARWSPSQLRGCMRKQIYKAIGAPKADPVFDAEKEAIFDRGHVFGSWVAAYLEAAEQLPELGITNVRSVCRRGEALLRDDGTQIAGFSDVLFNRYGHEYVVEVKSKEDAAAWPKMSSPQAEHEAQCNDYMHMSGAKAGWIFYIGVTPHPKGGGKTRIGFKEFFRRYSPELWEKTKNRVMMLDWFMSDRERLAPKSDSPFFECNNCPYAEWCNAEMTPARMEEIIERAKADAIEACRG